MMVDVLPDNISVGGMTVKHKPFSAIDMIAEKLEIERGEGRPGRNRLGDVLCQIWQRPFSGPATLWMSDSANERYDHLPALRASRGNVLVGGLGLGLFTLATLIKPQVRRVTVLEISEDVINLVGPYIRDAAKSIAGDAAAELEIIHADLLEWRPPQEKYDTLWFDVWPTLCTDDLEVHATLAQRFARRKNPGAFFGCWGNGFLKEMRRRGY